MLANSNLSIIPSKPTTNMQSAGDGAVASIDDSFDAAFQQANNSLSSKSNTDVTTHSESAKQTPLNDSTDSLSTVSIASDVGTQAATLNDGESVTSEMSNNVLALSANADALVPQENVNTLTEASANLPIAGSGVLVADAINTSDGVSELSDQALLSGLNEESVIGKGGTKKTIALEGEASLSGNSLQSKGVNLASLNTAEQPDHELGVTPIANDQLNDSTQVVGEAGVRLSDKVDLDTQIGPSQNGVTESSLNVSPADFDANAISANTATKGALISPNEEVRQVNLAKLDLVSDKNTNLNLDGNQLSGVNEQAVNKKDITTGELDVAAGLAMIGAGTLQTNKAMSAKELAVAAKQTPPITANLIDADSAGGLTKESADLDWIMQQMSNEPKVVNETILVPESAKQQLATNTPAQIIGQNSDSSIKQLVPLSLGVASTESGLVNSDGGDNSIEVASGNVTNTKLEVETLKQIETGVGVKTGLGDSSVTSSTVSPAAQLGGEAKLGLAVNVNNNQTSMTMQVPPTHPNWSSEMGEKVMWMNKQGLQQAEIHLDPPELGSLTVKVTIDSDVASVSFVAASPQVKDLLEGQVQRLREMMAQQGVELAEVDVNVSQQGSGSNPSGDGANDQLARNGQEDEDLDAEFNQQETRVSKSKVDFYA